MEVDENRAVQVMARKYIYDHRHPIVKVTLPPQKLFFAPKNDEETALIKEHQDQLSIILGHQRVEKRTSRARAIWLADKGVAKVTKIIKNIVKYFGYQNKDGVFLYPEEMLYLLESNRIEVTVGNTSLSIEKAYELFLKIPGVNLTQYKVYKKLANLGYKLIRFEQITSKISHRIKKIEVKRTLEESMCGEFPKLKKIKKCDPAEIEDDELKARDFSTNLQAGTSSSKEAEYISNIFNRLRENMPRECTKKLSCIDPDYCVSYPTNILKAEPDFNLFICDNNIIDRKNFNSNIPNIYAICIDDVSFYRFSEINLPYI